MSGLGAKVRGLGVEGLGFGVWGLGFRVSMESPHITKPIASVLIALLMP